MSAMSPFRDEAEVGPIQAEAWPAVQTASLPFVQTEAEPEAQDEAVGAEWEVEDLFEVAGEEDAGQPILTLYPLLSKAVLDALDDNQWPVAVKLAAGSGYKDVNELTNIVFYSKHPDVIGRKIRPDERDLARDWLAIRDGIVKPALHAAPDGVTPAPAGPSSGPVTSPTIPASRLEWPGATADELAFMRAVYERHFKNSNVRGNSFVWDLPKEALGWIEPERKYQTRKDTAQAASRLLEAARTELGGNVRIGVVSAYRPATQQFVIWQGKGRNGGFPAYYRIALKKGLIVPGDFGPESVAKMAKYLGGYIAFPGFSNHQDGLAIDFGEEGPGGWGTVRDGSPFHRWLKDNATARFGFHPLSNEAWHWTYHGTPDVPAAQEASADAAVRAGTLSVQRVPLLARHAGTPPDLVLGWNDMPSAPDEVDVVVHLHGYWKHGLTLPANIVPVSGLDLTPIDDATGSARTRPTLTVLPRGHDTGVRQKSGPYNVYTFPALVTKDGLPDLVRFALDRFAAEVGGVPPRLGRLILTAHSGGGQALLQILRYHDPHQVHVYDALYWQPDALVAWARKRIRKDRDAIAGGASPSDYMPTQGGGLRVFYQGRYAGGTRPNSLSVRNALAPDVDATIAPWYRVEASKYDHFQIPRLYGWRVLADGAADVPSAYAEDARRHEAELETADFGESELWEAEDEAPLAVLPELEAPTSPIQRVTDGPMTKDAADYFLWVLDDVVYNGTSRLIADLSDRARPAFEKLFAGLAGHDVRGRKLGGRERRESFDEAVLALRDVLAFATDEQRAALRRKRDGLLRGEASDRVDNSVIVGKRILEIPGDGHPREQAHVLHEALPTIVHALQVATEHLHRLAEGGHEHYEAAIKAIEQELEKSPHYHELEQLLDEVEKDAQPGKRTVERLGVLIAFLGTIDGWLTLSDEELRHHLTEIHSVMPTVSSFAELVKAVTEIGIGTVSLTAAFASGIAKLAGDEALAAEAMTVAGQAGALLGNVVAGIEIVHGIFVLLDAHATRAQKEDAVAGIASAGAWFIGRWIGGAAVGGPASIAIAASYLMLKVSMQLYWQGALGVNALLMRETFEYLRDMGTNLARVSGRVERAAMLLQRETDPIKANPLRVEHAESENLLATMLDDFLAHCTPGGAKDMGWGGSFATAPGNVEMLSEAFAPLLGYRSVKSGSQLLAGAAAVVQRIAWCLVHAREIEIASTQHKHLSDIAGAPAP